MTFEELVKRLEEIVTKLESGNVKLKFGTIDKTLSDWRSAVDSSGSITVGRQTYSKFDSDTGNPGNNQYEWQDSEGQGIDTLYLDKTSFEPGANTVVISAEGYKDLTINVNIEEPEKPPAQKFLLRRSTVSTPITATLVESAKFVVG